MQLRSFVAGAGLVAAASALLLPPDLTITDDDSITTLPVPVEIDADVAVSNAPQSQTLELECPGCLQFGRKHRKEIPSHLKLHFTIESTDGADRLTLNGYELYPHPVPLQDTLTAPVLPDMADRRAGAPRFRGGPGRAWKNQPLGFALQSGEVATDDDDDLQLINVELQIVEVGNIFIERIPNVQVQLVKTPSGKLAIGAIETIDFRGEDAGGKQKECSTTVCKWKALFFEKLSHIFKSCGGPNGPPPPPHHHGEHQHGHGHGPHHHMGHRSGWGHGLRIFVRHILFPILIGIVAGISASIIGMIFGTFVVFLWRTFVRRRGSRRSHRCRYAHKAAIHERAADEEKSGLLDVQEEAEAPPAYMESTTIVAEEKKPENES
ncbi:hypothetical protein F4803DRAFT_364308 [Xylaria telfairii]|nr:hypothetical protein F4803DRAFT_364308 [Xylaria telfairii]